MATNISSRFLKTGDFYLLEDKDMRGGFRIVASLAERDAIPLQARKTGMIVRVIEDNETTNWELGHGKPITNAGWVPAKFGASGDFIPTAGGNLDGELFLTEFASMNFNEYLKAEVVDGNLQFTSTTTQDPDDPEPEGMMTFNDGEKNTIEINPRLGQIVCDYEVGLSSDRNKKTDVKRIEESLSKTLRMHGYTFKKHGSDVEHIGLIAQEVKQVVPQAVGNMSDGSLTVYYANLVGLLVENVHELTAWSKKQDEEIKSLKEQMDKGNK